MKIIITENQMNEFDEYKKKLIKAIERHGFDSVMKMTSLDKLTLLKLTSMPIKGYTDSNYKDGLSVKNLMKDLIDENEDYRECILDYSSWDGSVQWICDFNRGDKTDVYFSYATPYWEDDKTIIQSNKIMVYKDGVMFNDYEDDSYITTFDNPEKFNNVNKLIDWFENTYKPKTYEIILEDFRNIRNNFKLV